MAELVDALVSGISGEILGSSSLLIPTIYFLAERIGSRSEERECRRESESLNPMFDVFRRTSKSKLNLLTIKI